MSKTFNINQGASLPWHFRFFGHILIIGSLFTIQYYILLALVMALGGVFIVALKEGLVINKEEKFYWEYSSLLGIKTGKRIAFDSVEKLYINSNYKRTKAYTAHTGSGQTFEEAVFDGYLKFDNGVKLHIIRLNKKDDIIKIMKELAAYLQVDLFDNTQT